VKKSVHSTTGVSSVVGNVLLVAIVFITASMFAGLVLTGNFTPNPSVTYEVEQTKECDRSLESICETVVTIKIMDNADYVLIANRTSAGSTVPTDEVIYSGIEPSEDDDIPNSSADTSILDESTSSSGEILVGPGDKYIIRSDVGTEIAIYAGLDGYEQLVGEYTVRPKN
jgi:FlaG/FlaF family flagellin (archaellin)